MFCSTHLSKESVTRQAKNIHPESLLHCVVWFCSLPWRPWCSLKWQLVESPAPVLHARGGAFSLCCQLAYILFMIIDAKESSGGSDAGNSPWAALRTAAPGWNINAKITQMLAFRNLLGCSQTAIPVYHIDFRWTQVEPNSYVPVCSVLKRYKYKLFPMVYCFQMLSNIMC